MCPDIRPENSPSGQRLNAAAAPRVLILGGTAEGRALSHRLDGDYTVIYSLAGRTRHPLPAAGKIISGGFGGSDGLTAFLKQEGIAALIDATHPFAARISAAAVKAAGEAGIPCLHLRRPPWRVTPDHRAADFTEAATLLARLRPARPFLALGQAHLAPFAAVLQDRFCLLRFADPPAKPLALNRYALEIARAPFTLRHEKRLLAAYGIDLLIARNAGGGAGMAKIAAARELGTKLLLIDRPPPPRGVAIAASTEAAEDWLRRRLP